MMHQYCARSTGVYISVIDIRCSTVFVVVVSRTERIFLHRSAELPRVLSPHRFLPHIPEL